MTYTADSLFAKIVGANPTIASLVALGGQAATHVSNFRRYEPGHYAYGKKQGSRYWEVANYYDRAFIYYVWHAAETGAAADDYLRKAHELAINYRDTYAPAGDVSAHWSMPCGPALHYATTNDATSKAWLKKVANNFNVAYYTDNLDDLTAEMDNRMQARCLEAWLLAHLTTGDAKWAGILRKALTDILKTQTADGNYPFEQVQNGGAKTFMIGVLNDAMMFYRRAFEDDARILPSITKSCNFMWDNLWVPSAKAFKYTEKVQGEQDPAPDLNNLIIGGYMATGQTDRVKAIFEGSFGTWFDGDKQFNQNYRESHRTCAQFAGAISAWEGGAPPIDPPIDPPPPTNEADIEGAKRDLEAAHAALDQAYAAIDAAMLKLG